MSEEIQDASVVVPRAIMFTIVINGSLAFGMLLATLFSLTDVEGALNTPTTFPFMEILRHSTGSVAAATVLASVLVVMQFCANVGLLAAASRMCESYSLSYNSLFHQSTAPETCLLVLDPFFKSKF